MRTVFLLFLSFSFFVLALKSRIAGLFTYWWFGIFRPHDWDWGGVLTTYKLPLIAAVLLILPSLIQKHYPRLNNSLAILILAWFLSLFLADLVNGCDSELFFRTSTISDLFILLYVSLLTSHLVSNLKVFYWLLFVIAVSIGFHSGKGGIVAMISSTTYYDRDQLSGLFSGSNAYALGSGMLMFFMIFAMNNIHSKYIFESKSKWYASKLVLNVFKLILLIFIFGTFYNLIALQSRGSFISVCGGLFLLALLHKNRVRIIFAVSLILAIGLTVVPLPEGFSERIASAFAEEEELDNSAASRPHFWQTAMSMTKANPTGVGPGCYAYYYRFYDATGGQYGDFRSVHSSHFQILADSGYLGFIIWICLHLVSYKKLFRLRKEITKHFECEDKKKLTIDIANTLICVQTVFLIGGSFYEYAYNDIIWLVFGLVISLELICKKAIAEQDTESSSMDNANPKHTLQSDNR